MQMMRFLIGLAVIVTAPVWLSLMGIAGIVIAIWALGGWLCDNAGPLWLWKERGPNDPPEQPPSEQSTAITEGYSRKGGQNPPPDMNTARPAPPRPWHR